MKKLLLILLLTPTLLQAAPQERWYQVELILFSYNSNDYRKSELWPVDYTEPQIESSRELGKATKTGAQAFTLLPTEALKLGGAAARIRSAPDMQLVLHLGWLQPGLAEDKAVAVHIYDGMLEEINHRSARNSQGGTQTARPKLDGTLRLILSRYLHLESDLIWRDPLSAEELALRRAVPAVDDSTDSDTTKTGTGEQQVAVNNAAGDGTPLSAPQQADAPESALITQHVYRMKQSRRMRSNEIHYLDHPRFGIVAQVTPYETGQP